MRRITAALLLTFCLAAGEMAHAQSQKQAAETKRLYTQQPPSPDGVKQNNKDTDNKQQKNRGQDQKDRVAQSNCAPDPKAAGEGDPDAPQNHVEYGGGG